MMIYLFYSVAIVTCRLSLCYSHINNAVAILNLQTTVFSLIDKEMRMRM